MNSEQAPVAQLDEGESAGGQDQRAKKAKPGCFRSCLLVLGIMFLVIVGGGYLAVVTMSEEVVVERSTTIAASPEIVFGEVDDVRRWERWSPWMEIDPEIQFVYMAIPRGKYAGYTWKSDNDQVGSGMLMVTVSEPNERVMMDWTMNRQGQQPLKAVADFKFAEVDGGTEVTWSIRTRLQGIEKLLGPVLSYETGVTFERGLERLKEVSEAEVENPTPHFVPKVVEPEPTESSEETGNNSPAQ
ncbi:MAG TPA: hypothetical protein DCY79_04720 [Planctomycetaceae bacterium]|nr:hypothetical protein [Blastopirellula sp.]HAY79091.1 hypothetical protein [Planctomycetaceae bacterium]|tara:strand:- start:41 stop:769 length:729 start_codon:yes stop_codon:yes gene_type:complete